MTETSLCRLHIDPSDDEGGGIQPTEVMKAGAGRTGCGDGRYPDPMAPVRIAQRTTSFVYEHECIAVCLGELESLEVLPQHADDGRRHEHGASTRLRLGRAEDVATAGPSHQRLDHGQAARRQVDPSYPQTGHFGPAQSQHGAEPDHGSVLDRHLGGNAGDVLWGQVEATGAFD